MNPRVRTILLWALLPVALLLVGVVNYFAGGFSPSEEVAEETVRLDFGSAQLDRYGSSTVLELPWGNSGSQVALAQDPGGLPISTLEAVISEDDGGLLIVDHPSTHIGARVRRYRADGALADTVLTPSGSTLFTSHEGRLVYVVAKQADNSERLVVREGSRETTYVVPLSINSGSILGLDGDIWVNAAKTAFDNSKQEVTATEIMVPVVIDGRQATDQDATDAVREGWRSVDGDVFTRNQVVVGYGSTSQVTQTIGRDEDGATLEIPGRSTPLDVDGAGLVYVRLEPEELGSEVRRLAATFGVESRTDEILVGGFDGSLVGRIVVPASIPTVGDWSRFAVSADGDLLAAVSDSEGVRIVRYEAVSSDEQ